MTATRHEEALSKVPISVTALTQETMDNLGIKDFQDVARFTPGVTIDNSGTNAISIRGISSSGGAGTTGIYIDDTPIQMRSLGFNPDDTLPKTFDLQRVEVLRGPQGTLFGAGAEGGAVRYILTQPSLTQTDTYVRSEASYTQYGQPSSIRHRPWSAGHRRHPGRARQHLVPLRRRLDRPRRPGHRRARQPQRQLLELVMGRLAAIWQAGTNLTVTPSFLYQRQDKNDDSTYWPAYSESLQGGVQHRHPGAGGRTG